MSYILSLMVLTLLLLCQCPMKLSVSLFSSSVISAQKLLPGLTSLLMILSLAPDLYLEPRLSADLKTRHAYVGI